jgi:hypothetical protein
MRICAYANTRIWMTIIFLGATDRLTSITRLALPLAESTRYTPHTCMAASEKARHIIASSSNNVLWHLFPANRLIYRQNIGEAGAPKTLTTWNLPRGGPDSHVDPILFTNSRRGFEPHCHFLLSFFLFFFCTLFAQPNGDSTLIDTPPHASHTREHDDIIFSPYIVRPSHTGAISLPRGDFWQDQDPWGFKTRLRNMATSTLAYFFYRLNPLTHPCSHNLYLGLRPICCAIRMFLSLCTHSTRLFHDTRAIGP